MKSKMLDTSIEGYRAAGIVITQDQLNQLGFLNAIMNADREKGVAADPVFYMAVLLRIMGVLPEDAMTEPEHNYGRFLEPSEHVSPTKELLRKLHDDFGDSAGSVTFGDAYCDMDGDVTFFHMEMDLPPDLPMI